MSLNRKACIENGCSYPSWARGRCKAHDAIAFPNKYRINKVSIKKKSPEIKKPTEINTEYYIPILEGRRVLVCEETSESLRYNKDFKNNKELLHRLKSWCAHILPKAHFKTVATDTDNLMILSGMYSTNQAHAEYDSTWEKASKMKVAEKAIVYIESVMDKLTDVEKARARGVLEKLKQKM